MSLLNKIRLGMVIGGLVLIMPQMAPLLYKQFTAGNAELLNFTGLTYAGMMLFFFGIAIGKFKKKDDKKPFQLTKKMSDTSVDESRDHEFSTDDD